MEDKTIRIPIETHRELRILAAANGTKVGEEAATAIIKHIERERRKKRKAQ